MHTIRIIFGLEAGDSKQHEQLGGIGSGANKATSSARFCGVPVRSIHFNNASEPADSLVSPLRTKAARHDGSEE